MKGKIIKGKGIKTKSVKRVIALATAFIMALSVTACGGDSGKSGADFVYVPEFMEIEDENISGSVQYADGYLYYRSYNWDDVSGFKDTVVKYSLTDSSSSVLPIEFGESLNIDRFAAGPNGDIYAIVNDYSEGQLTPEVYTEPKRILCRYDANGEQISSYDLSDLWQEAMSEGFSPYIQNMIVDKESRIYLSCSEHIWLFDEECSYWGTVETGTDWISEMGCGKDGKVYFCYYNYTPDNADYILAEIDYDGKAVGATFENFIGGRSNGLTPGMEYDFLCNDGTSLYGYSLKSQEREKLFDWLDSDINGTYIEFVGQLDDGRIFAVIRDWQSRDNSIALLTKKKASEVPQKEIIVIGTMSAGSNLQAAAVQFNKSNDKYHISIKEYVDYNSWSNTSWADALTNLNNDITSSHCPDIIDLSSLNMEQLAAKGVFEDLTPYLENSSLSKDSFVKAVLDVCTYDDILVSIPASFVLQTVVGKGSEVGYETGWTIDEMIAYADEHPGAQLFDHSQKSSILDMCMMFNESAFIDWSTGECKFDTPEFKSLLEFVNRFPDEYQYEDDDASTPTKIQHGEILLETVGISDFDGIQMYNEIFGGDMSCIGYPTTDGGSGTALMVNEAYAITSKSKMKDGAWEFIEYYLTQSDENNMFMFQWGFPNDKEKLAAMAKEAVGEVNENAALENGSGMAVAVSGMSSVMYQDGWSYTYRDATQDEVDLIMQLIETARPANRSNDAILNIINEEADAFWQGQKSVDDVANIIQSRISIYVNENS